MAYFFGVLTYPVLIGGVAYSVWIIYNNDKKKIPKRYYAGTAFIGIAILLFQGCREFEAHEAWYGAQKIFVNLWRCSVASRAACSTKPERI